MFKIYILILALVGTGLTAIVPKVSRAPTYVTRAQWGARNPTSITPMANPVANVVIHHTFSPGACTSQTACINTVKGIQNSHMDGNRWDDIGYSFLVGGDNRAYIGRGWDRVGSHAIGFNDKSIGISVIGDWTNTIPPAAQIQVIKDLIADGVRQGKIRSNYRLLGHRQATATECPGNALYREIQKWPQWSSADFPEDSDHFQV